MLQIHTNEHQYLYYLEAFTHIILVPIIESLPAQWWENKTGFNDEYIYFMGKKGHGEKLRIKVKDLVKGPW